MFVRHAPRQVLHSVAAYVEHGLDELGWTSPDASERPFGATRVVPRRSAVITGNQITKLAAGTLATTLGDENVPENLELGGPLTSQDFPIFIDILMDEDAYALALASDVRDHLLGRFEFSQRWLPLTDQSTQTIVPGWHLSIDDVERVRPDNTLSLYWQVVKATITAEFEEVLY